MIRLTRLVGTAIISLLAAYDTLSAQDIKPAVLVAAVVEQDVTPSFTYVGWAEAVERVELRARVEGVLVSTNFRDGADVSADQLLFQIETEPYEVVVDQRKADLASARASLQNAATDLKRKRDLADRDVVAQASLDQAIAAEASAKAAVLKAQAALRAAELNLEYTEIASPIAGRVSAATVDDGNLVGPGTGPLAVVTSLDPIHVTIALSEKLMIEARRRGVDLAAPRVAPRLILGDGTAYEHAGSFDYLSPEVNRATDTITARAVFANPDRVLLPGQFVTVKISPKEKRIALVVPQASVQTDREGYFVLVVNADSKVEQRRITVGGQMETNWIVQDGLSAGERVILEGLQKVKAGMSVSATDGGS